MMNMRETTYSIVGFLSLSPTDIWGWRILYFGRLSQAYAECLAISLASTLQIVVAIAGCDNRKCLQILTNVA